MNLSQSLQGYRLVKVRAEAMMGVPTAWLFLNFGRLFDWPGWSDRFLSELTRTEEGLLVLMRLLDILKSGGTVPVLLMYSCDIRHYPVLQVIEGQLYEVWRGGRERVRFP
jgi:hypothetical protein